MPTQPANPSPSPADSILSADNPDATDAYSDIIRLPRPRSSRPAMSLETRAAQFAPFAALSEATPPDPDTFHD